jgi:hypothetical protein
VALGLAPVVALPDGLRLVGFEPLLELVGVHVDHLLELLADLLVALKAKSGGTLSRKIKVDPKVLLEVGFASGKERLRVV